MEKPENGFDYLSRHAADQIDKIEAEIEKRVVLRTVEQSEQIKKLEGQVEELIPFLKGYYNRLNILHMHADNDWDAEAYRIEIERMKPVFEKFTSPHTPPTAS